MKLKIKRNLNHITKKIKINHMQAIQATQPCKNKSHAAMQKYKPCSHSKIRAMQPCKPCSHANHAETPKVT